MAQPFMLCCVLVLWLAEYLIIYNQLGRMLQTNAEKLLYKITA